MKVFAQLSKVDVEKRLVYGIAAQEVADHSGEIMDYEKSKPNFQKWSEEMSKSTDGLSLGNIRSMHSNIAAGKVVDMSFDDVEKSILITAKVVDNNEWEKVIEGVYTGFSMGGKYGKRWKDGDLQRYEAIPSEVSLVDRPCIPTAKFFEIQKADGSMIKMEFKNVNEEVSTENENEVEYQVVGTEEDIAELGKSLNDNSLTVADAVVIINKSLKEKSENDVKKSLDVKFKDDLSKGLYDVGRLAELLQSIYYLTLSAKCESDHEMDDSPIPGKLKSIAESVAEVLKEMATEEADELIEDLKEDMQEGEEEESEEMMIMSQSISGLVKASVLKDKECFSKMVNDINCKLNVKKEDKDLVEKDIAKADTQQDMQKFTIDELFKSDIINKYVKDAISEVVEPLSKQLNEANEKIVKLESQPMPTKGVLRAVAKGDDISDGINEVSTLVVRKSDGSVDTTASLIKNIHAQGGQHF